MTTTALLAPSCTVTTGSQSWKEQVVAIELDLAAAPGVDTFRLTLPSGAPLDAAPGDPVRVILDGGEGAHDVFAGRIATITRTLREIEVIALNGGGDLAQFRPATTYEQASVASVIRSLCGDAGVDPGALETGPILAFYSADPGRSALEHVARLAAWVGALARFKPDSRLDVQVVKADTAEVAFRYGREIIDLRQSSHATAVETIVVAGEAGAGDASAPESLMPVTDFFAGNRPDGPSKESRWTWAPALRTAGAAGTAGAALERQYRSSRRRSTMTTFLVPSLRPGTVLEIQDLPAGLDKGPFWVNRVRHRFSAVRATSTCFLWGGGEGFDPTALMGALLGALGGF